MSLDEALALIWFVCSIGVGLFALSAILNHLRGKVAKEDWKKPYFSLFYLPSFRSFFNDDVKQASNF